MDSLGHPSQHAHVAAFETQSTQTGSIIVVLRGVLLASSSPSDYQFIISVN